jgi:hypothetical protein
MTLRIRLMKRALLFEATAGAIRALDVTVTAGEPLGETSTHVIREMVVACHRREHSESVLKVVRAIDGVEVMNFSFSR